MAPGFRRTARIALPGLALIGLPGLGLWAFLWRPYHYEVVDPRALYRSGQLTRPSLEWVHAKTGLRSIIDLVEESRDDKRVLDERAFAEERGIRYVHLPVPPKPEPLEPVVEKFLSVMDDPKNRPALVHCMQGVKRTGLMVAVYQMEYMGLSNAEALEALPAFGRDLDDYEPRARDFIARYVPRSRRPGTAPRSLTR